MSAVRLEYDQDYGFIVSLKSGKEWEIQNMCPEMFHGWKCPWPQAVDKARELARNLKCKIVAFTKEGKRRTVSV